MSATAETEQPVSVEQQLSDAAKHIASLVRPQQGQAEPVAVKKAPQAEAEDETTEDQDSHEDEETVSEDEAESAEDSDSETTEEDDSASLIEVKVGGKVEKLPLDEVKKGYERFADYTRKTQELSAERKAIESERVHNREVLSKAEEILKSSMPKPPTKEEWDALYLQDPNQWAIKRQLWNDHFAQLNAVAQEKAELEKRAKADQDKALKQTTEVEYQRLLEVMPRWKDEKIAANDLTANVNYIKNQGYSQEDIDQIVDHRLILMIDKARRHDEAMADKPKPVKTGGSSPKPLGSGNVQGTETGRVAATGSNRRAFEQASKRLNEEGSLSAAAAAIAALKRR